MGGNATTHRVRTLAVTMRRPSLVLVVAFALVVACSGDDDGATTTTGTVASTSPTTLSSSTSVTSTEPPTTTTSPTSTSAAPSTPTEPTAATTLPDDIDQIRTAVAAAVVAAWEAFDAVVRNPTSKEANATLRSRSTEKRYQDVADRFIVKYVVNDLAERTSPDVPASVTPYPETLVYDPVSSRATIETCFVSTNRLVQIQPDGTEDLQDDRVAVVLGTDNFVLVDGVWLDDGGFVDEVLDGETACPER